MKDGNLSDGAFNNLAKINLSYSAHVSRGIASKSIPSFYEERMKLLRDMINEIQVDKPSGKSYKRFSWILTVDNYASTKYAKEQTGKKPSHQRPIHYLYLYFLRKTMH